MTHDEYIENRVKATEQAVGSLVKLLTLSPYADQARAIGEQHYRALVANEKAFREPRIIGSK
jgi:hypothetical protein